MLTFPADLNHSCSFTMASKPNDSKEPEKDEKCVPGFQFAIEILHKTAAQSEVGSWGSDTSSNFSDSGNNSGDDVAHVSHSHHHHQSNAFSKKSVKKAIPSGKHLNCAENNTKKELELGKKSFRWLEEQVLQAFIHEQHGPKLPQLAASKYVIPPRPRPGELEEKKKEKDIQAKKVMSEKLEQILSQIDQQDENGETELPEKTIADADCERRKQWAAKQAESFIREIIKKEERTISERALPIDGPIEINRRVRIFLDKQGARRRRAVEKMEIKDAAIQRAERSIWRATVDASRPVFPHPVLIHDWYKNIKDKEGTLLGPGSYDVNYEMQNARCECPFANFGSCCPRFKKEKELLGAGTKYTTNPWINWEKACDKYKHPSCFIPFESTPCNWRSKSYRPGSGLAPNTYPYKTFIDELNERNKMWKQPQRRCYAEHRDLIAYGYFKTQPVDSKMGPGAYEPYDSTKKRLFSRCNRNKGKFSRMKESEKHTFEDPLGPGTYDPYLLIEKRLPPRQVKAAFGRTADKPDPPPYTSSRLVAPGYFRISRNSTAIKGDGLQSAFKSKTEGRPPGHLIGVLNERLKAASESAYPKDKREVVKVPSSACLSN